ncbi:hypothetical protein, partial [Leptospira interrogans]|uniref:hypothetical protein n=1 Tax=Leptospira interrogans TaxID=173 RepID=UPI001E5A5A09
SGVYPDRTFTDKLDDNFLVKKIVREQPLFPSLLITRVGSGDGAWIHVKNLVSISCHIKPYVQFSRIRLSDSLLPPVFKYYLVNPPER